MGWGGWVGWWSKVLFASTAVEVEVRFGVLGLGCDRNIKSGETSWS